MTKQPRYPSPVMMELMKDAQAIADANRALAHLIDPDPRPLRPPRWQFWKQRAYRRELAAWRARQPEMPSVINIPRFERLTSDHDRA